MQTTLNPSKIQQYVDDVLQGRQKVGRKVKLAVERFVRELALSKDPAYPWRFDWALAQRPIDYMETFLTPQKGDYDKMVLMPWQCFFEGNLYGWVSKETGLRRFKEGLLCVGRGNGKSTMIAGNATYAASKDGERGADIYLLANSKEQAGITYNECSAQIKGSALLNSHFKALKSEIRYPAANGKILRLSSDSRKLDGLNPHLAIFDEIHEYLTFKLINVVQRGMNKRKQPLLLYITTMGTVLDGVLMQLYTLSDNVLNGIAPPRAADRFFTMIYEMDPEDDVEDPSNWVKANPAIGSFLDLDTLVDDWEVAKLIPDRRRDFITKQLNCFANDSEMSFLDFDVLKRNNAVIDLQQLRGRDVRGGFDLSTSEDFTAAVLLFRLDDGRWFVMHHSWIPQRKVDLDNEKIPYHEWALKGYLTIHPGEYVTKEDVCEWFMEQANLYDLDIRSIGFDPAQAPTLVKLMRGKGLVCNVVRQGALTISPCMKEAKEIMLDGNLVFNNDPMFFWYLKNVVLRRDPSDRQKGNWMPTKANRYKKIDGFMAFLDALAEYIMREPAPLDQDVEIEVYKLA